MDTRLYILAGTFLLLVLSIIYLLIASFRAARIKRSIYQPTFVIDSPALPSAQIVVDFKPDARDARFAPPSSDVYAAMQEPLRTGSWRPDQPDVDSVEQPTQSADDAFTDVEPKVSGLLEFEDAYVSELIEQLQDNLEADEVEGTDEVEEADEVEETEPEPSVAPSGGEDYWTRLISEQERLVQDRSQEEAVELAPSVPVTESVPPPPVTIPVESDELEPESGLTFTQEPVARVAEPAVDHVSAAEPEVQIEPEPMVMEQPEDTPLVMVNAATVPTPPATPVVERPSAVVSREIEVESRPRAKVGQPLGSLQEDSTPSAVPISSLPRIRTSAQDAVRAAASDRALVAPVEMWFGDFRIGVKAGTRTYEQFRRYADVILRDLDASERARGVR